MQIRSLWCRLLESLTVLYCLLLVVFLCMGGLAVEDEYLYARRCMLMSGWVSMHMRAPQYEEDRRNNTHISSGSATNQ